MTPVSVAVEADGIAETVRAFSGIEQDLRKEANAELRAAARVAAGELVTRLRASAAASATPQARLVAKTVKVKSDRYPTVSIGGRGTIPRTSRPAGGRIGAIVWGSERGGRNFVAGAGGEYWIAPAVDGYATSGAVTVFRRAVYEIAHRYRVA